MNYLEFLNNFFIFFTVILGWPADVSYKVGVRPRTPCADGTDSDDTVS